MNILFQYFTGGGGALSNIILLLKAIAKQYPDDFIDIVCSKSSDLHVLEPEKNINVITYGGKRHQEVDRAFLGFGGLVNIANQTKADIIWSLNLGSYVSSKIPQVLSVNNPHQVYPWEVTRYHPDSRINVAALRWFFRKTLSVSDGVIVQTPIMGEFIRKIYKTPLDIAVVPKAVENSDDVNSDPLPQNVQEKINSGFGKKAFTFLYVSTYVPHKNHDTLVKAFNILAAESACVRLLLTITHEELVSIAGEKAIKLVESGHIIPLGWVSKSHLRSLYDISDACLMPSVLESLSSAHLEAMQWSKPQIVADFSYSRDLCGSAAVYVSAEDPKEWVKNIKSFVNDPELRRFLVKKGLERMSLFPETWAVAANKVHIYLEKIVTNNISK